MESAAISSSSYLIVNSHVAESAVAGLDPGWLRLFQGNCDTKCMCIF